MADRNRYTTDRQGNIQYVKKEEKYRMTDKVKKVVIVNDKKRNEAEHWWKL
jgi:hypothetical protein